MTLETLCQQATNSLLDMDEDLAYETLDAAIAAQYNLTELLTSGYSVGMQELGEQFSAGEVFLPDLMYAAEIMQTVSARIEEQMVDSDAASETSGTAVFCTVQGDVHDIGKGICCALLKAGGFKVYDLGRDVDPEVIVAKAEEVGADIIGMSALLTTTMTVQKTVIDMLTERGLREKYKVMVGGAPVTSRWAEKIGADCYSEDAADCVEKAGTLI